jgi:hydroxymethylbilane synthase
VKLGTRGSALALWQANHVAGLLRARDPASAVEIVVIKTTGDVRQDIPLQAVAGKGVFVREIEAALLRGDVDLAVHSAKDLQSEDPPGLTLAAFCERADPRDALVSPHGTLDQLPHGALVGTGAPRRIAQLRHRRPDLRFVEIRGNVDTRLAKLARGDCDALVLAVAGLERLGRADVITERLSVEVCLPQVSQACVAVQCRADDAAPSPSLPRRATMRQPAPR